MKIKIPQISPPNKRTLKKIQKQTIKSETIQRE
jgi:hypothetical protein